MISINPFAGNYSMSRLLGTMLLVLVFGSCGSKQEPKKPQKNFEKGSFGYDLDFLGEYYSDLIILENNKVKLIVSPSLQGRVMTSTSQGLEGQSFGWLNYDLIKSGEQLEHINPVGGEERFWLGPEGGQFSIYFKQGDTFEFDNWYVPKELDTESFELVRHTSTEAYFQKEMSLTNYSDTKFDLKVERRVSLLDNKQLPELLETTLPGKVEVVGFETVNTLSNTGQHEWTKDNGLLSIWILSMFKPSDETVVVIPFKYGEVSALGKVVVDDYFGKVPPERLRVTDSVLFFKADGKERGKIGVSPLRAKPILGSYDARNKVLTIAQYSLPADNTDYVNSLWAQQERPYEGDAVNSYNDGPLGDEGQLGPFYELESSSPAAKLRPGEKLTHIHRTYHFSAEEADLNEIAMLLLGVSLKDIKSAL